MIRDANITHENRRLNVISSNQPRDMSAKMTGIQTHACINQRNTLA